LGQPALTQPSPTPSKPPDINTIQNQKIDSLNKSVKGLEGNIKTLTETTLLGIDNKINNLNWLNWLWIPLLFSLALQIWTKLSEIKNSKVNMSETNNSPYNLTEPRKPEQIQISISPEFKKDLQELKQELKTDLQSLAAPFEKILESLNQLINVIEKNIEREQGKATSSPEIQQLQNESFIRLIDEKIESKFNQVESRIIEKINELIAITPPPPPNPIIEPTPEPTPPETIPQVDDTTELELIQAYRNGTILTEYPNLEKVSVDDKMVEDIRGGSANKIILTKQDSSRYWIISNKYLVPQHNNLNNMVMPTVQKLFDCPDYESSKSNPNSFTLVKTAKVTRLGADSWQLEEKGFLDYSSNQGGG
jgi:hypothetical protein